MGQIKDQSQSSINSYFKRAIENKSVWKNYQAMFDKSVSVDNLSISYMRTIMNLGAPLRINGKKYQSRKDNEDEQDEYVENYILDLEDDIN